jgi:hypothetical protein
MKDILLKFDSKEQAVTFAEDNGFTSIVEEEGEEKVHVIEQGEDYVFTVIGEHWIDTGETETFRDETGTEYEHPIMVSDEAWWVLFRDMADRDLSPAEDFVVWDSQMTERVRARNEDGEFEADNPDTEEDEAWIEQPVPRPANAPDRVFC